MTEEVVTKNNNAKPVEVYDMEGNLLQTYRSGIAASQALGFLQGDISLCCRGLKDSLGGYRFKFVDNVYSKVESNAVRGLKRGYAIEYVPEPGYQQSSYLSSGNLASMAGAYSFGNQTMIDGQQLTRTSRTSRNSRGDQYILDDRREQPSSKDIASIRTRKWSRQLVSIGSLQVMKWVPNREKATAELQIISNNDGHMAKRSRKGADGRRGRAKGRA